MDGGLWIAGDVQIGGEGSQLFSVASDWATALRWRRAENLAGQRKMLSDESNENHQMTQSIDEGQCCRSDLSVSMRRSLLLERDRFDHYAIVTGYVPTVQTFAGLCSLRNFACLDDQKARRPHVRIGARTPPRYSGVTLGFFGLHM